ncbi:hypothetical protein ACQ4M4_18030 [Leptolyngbya sp. AN02str]|uniref:hypothetical protein n=1 Tax=Leptolyngbya sp. AN02str TaxID=3423363 RepID=UPI003D31481D
MKITKVYYSRLANLGNYSNERISMRADLDEGDSPEEVIEHLRGRVVPLCGENAQELDTKRYRLQDMVSELKRKLEDYQQKWDQAAEFLRAQGIKPDAPNFPQFTNLLPSATEDSRVIDGEIDEEDYEDEDEY